MSHAVKPLFLSVAELLILLACAFAAGAIFGFYLRHALECACTGYSLLSIG